MAEPELIHHRRGDDPVIGHGPESVRLRINVPSERPQDRSIRVSSEFENVPYKMSLALKW